MIMKLRIFLESKRDSQKNNESNRPTRESEGPRSYHSEYSVALNWYIFLLIQD